MMSRRMEKAIEELREQGDVCDYRFMITYIFGDILRDPVFLDDKVYCHMTVDLLSNTRQVDLSGGYGHRTAIRMDSCSAFFNWALYDREPSAFISCLLTMLCIVNRTDEGAHLFYGWDDPEKMKSVEAFMASTERNSLAGIDEAYKSLISK